MIEVERIPALLRDRHQWVLWRMADRDGKPTKVPFQPNGIEAKANDPATWSDFETCMGVFVRGGYLGIGFEFSKDDPFCGIDLDSCRNKDTGAIDEWAKKIILEFDTYAEVSPSETGVKLFLLGKKSIASCKKTLGQGDHPAAIEIYDSGRYFCVTGLRLKGPTEPQERQQQLDGLTKELWPDGGGEVVGSSEWYDGASVAGRARKYLAKLPPAVSGQSGHNATFHAACVLVIGFGLPTADAMNLLREWNEACQPPWTERELQHKIDQASKQPGERNYLRNVQPAKWSGVNVPKYEAPRETSKSEPRITTIADAMTKYAEKLVSGKSTLVELGIGDLDYAIGGGIEPGEVMILAARPSHGKSLAALQMVHSWTSQNRPVIIISEEMSAIALGKRSLQFTSDIPEGRWPEEISAIHDSIADYRESHARAIIAESCGTTQAAIEQIDKAVAESKAQIAVIDYTQLLQSPGKGRYEQVTNTSVALRQTANRHGIILVLLCQLNREIEKRPKFRPQASDLRETGQLEQDADVIIFQVWPHKIDEQQPREEYQFFIEKNRNRGVNQKIVKARIIPHRQMIVGDKPGGKRYVKGEPAVREPDDFGQYSPQDFGGF